MRRSATAALAVLLVASLGTARGQQIANPELYRKSLRAAEEALRYFGAWDDSTELTRVNDIGFRLVQASSYTDLPFTFFLVDFPEPNAFALPGGHVFVTRGMLAFDLSDDMLAGLLGHEIAHVVLQHGIRMQHRATLLNILSQTLMMGVMIGAGGGNRGGAYDPYGRDPRNTRDNNDLLQGAAAAGVLVSQLMLRSYSREFEDDADEEGQRWAAGAGFDPAGTRLLMATMRARIPQSREYGYWQTHPFFDTRVTSARAREAYLKIQPPQPADALRQRTQAVVLDFLEQQPVEPPRAPARASRSRSEPPEAPLDAEVQELLEDAVLAIWPQGPRAEKLRLERLHALRTETFARPALAQDYGALIRAYEEQREAVARLTPVSPLLPVLEREIGALRHRRDAIYPVAKATFAGGVYETDFLTVFLSNFPDAPEVPAAALALADAESRLGRQTDAVSHYLRAWRLAPETDAGRRAREGLRNLASHLERLGALQQLAAQEEDPELRRLAEQRLLERANRFEKLENGAEYLERFPAGPMVGVVRERLNRLAEALLGEIYLYQAVGDHVKALDRIQQILTYAPFSPAAERLRENAVLAS